MNVVPSNMDTLVFEIWSLLDLQCSYLDELGREPWESTRVWHYKYLLSCPYLFTWVLGIKLGSIYFTTLAVFLVLKLFVGAYEVHHCDMCPSK